MQSQYPWGNPRLMSFPKFQKIQEKPLPLVELDDSSKNDFTSRFHQHRGKSCLFHIEMKAAELVELIFSR